MTPVITPKRREDAVTDKHPVRVTIEPGVVREVEDVVLVDLARQGLIHSYEHTAAAEKVLGGTIKGVQKWKPAEKGEPIVTADAAMTDPDGVNPTQKGE